MVDIKFFKIKNIVILCWPLQQMALKPDAFIIHFHSQPPIAHSKPPLLNRLPFNLIYAG